MSIGADYEFDRVKDFCDCHGSPRAAITLLSPREFAMFGQVVVGGTEACPACTSLPYAVQGAAGTGEPVKGKTFMAYAPYLNGK